MSQDLLVTMCFLEFPFPSYALWSLKLSKYHEYEYVFQQKIRSEKQRINQRKQKTYKYGLAQIVVYWKSRLSQSIIFSGNEYPINPHMN